MIESNNEFGIFEMFCDFCNDESEEFDTSGDFRAFIQEAKDVGWTIKKEKDVWTHKCPGCSAEI